jgi:predicted ATP-grasp superfamily ATP-dependent carboligase
MTGLPDIVTRPGGVLILGAEYQGLGLLRQLSTSGVRCAIVDQDSFGVAKFSCYRCPVHRSPPYDTDAFWPWLKELARQNGYAGWMVIPTDDEQVRQLALHHVEARTLFHYRGMPWEQYEAMYDKRLSIPWCRQQGVKTPVTVLPANRTDIPGPELPFPFIVKPAFKRNYYKHSKAKAIRVESAAELRSILDGVLREVDAKELLYQEIVPGDGRSQWSYAGLFWDGAPVSAFTACRRRQHPPDFGRASTYVVAIHDAEVERESRRVIAALGYTGLAEVEWKRDPRTGELKFLEVNARCWGWQSLATRVVGNLPKMQLDLLSGDGVSARAAEYGWRWVKYVTDIPVALHMLHRGELNVQEYFAGLHGRTVCCEWSDRDPRPFFMQLLLVPYLAIKRGY